MDKREQLKSMLNNMINDKPEQASLDLHNYFATKMREVSGIATPPAAVAQTQDEYDDVNLGDENAEE